MSKDQKKNWAVPAALAAGGGAAVGGAALLKRRQKRLADAAASRAASRAASVASAAKKSRNVRIGKGVGAAAAVTGIAALSAAARKAFRYKHRGGGPGSNSARTGEILKRYASKHGKPIPEGASVREAADHVRSMRKTGSAIQFSSFVDEMAKIAEEDKTREAIRHSLAAGAGTGAGIAGADLLAGQLAKRHPKLIPVIQSKAARYGVPGMMAAGSVYASHKYKKNVDDALQRMVGGDQ